MSLAVVGTDTDVGKTVVSALVLLRYPLAHYWKPVATGSRSERDVDFVRSCVGAPRLVIDEEFSFEEPLSPHLAARRAKRKIDLKRIRAAFRRHVRFPGRSRDGRCEASGKTAVVVEGAGGLLVPLTDRGDLQIDVLKSLRIPFLLVARTALGTINHTLLSLEAMRARDVEITGVVLNGDPQVGVRDAIERFGKTQVIAEVPALARGRQPTPLELRAAAKAFDEQGLLAKHLNMSRSYRLLKTRSQLHGR